MKYIDYVVVHSLPAVNHIPLMW